MKKCTFAFIFVLLAQNVMAQETIPLFEDIPVYEQSASSQNESKTNVRSEKAISAKQSTQPEKASQPRLGRNAEPLSSLVIAPFPNTTIEIDPSERKIKNKVENKPFDEKGIKETDLIKRETPLNMTESESAGAKKIMDEKARALSLNRHDVSKFKLAGIYLGLEPESVYEELEELGYTLQRVEKSIPLFKTTYYEELCRQKQGLTIVDEIKRCILDYAENDEVHYIFRETYVRPQSHETIQVSYSSPETMNSAYKIVYKNKGDNSLNTSRKNMAKKMRRQEEFWNMIFDTYGLPDENNKMIWGNTDTVYMQVLMHGTAYDAYVIMEDRMIQDKDFEAAQTDFQTLRKPTTFTINGIVPDEEDE